MSVPEPTDAIFWLSDVVISRDELEIELPASLDDFGLQKSGSLRLAKYVFAGDVWCSVSAFFDRHGLAIQRLVESGAAGAASLDVAYLVAAESVTRSAQIPADIASKVGRVGVDLVISTYPVNPD